MRNIEKNPEYFVMQVIGACRAGQKSRELVNEGGEEVAGCSHQGCQMVFRKGPAGTVALGGEHGIDEPTPWCTLLVVNAAKIKDNLEKITSSKVSSRLEGHESFKRNRARKLKEKYEKEKKNAQQLGVDSFIDLV
ncbi:MAG: hypothetical protein PVJ52_00570 [Candidatus Woesebacteria bacterium]|jgi:hypothetical protein